MFCKHCGNRIPDNATACPSCGVAAGPVMAPPPSQVVAYAPAGTKSKSTYVLLGVLLGFLGLPGIHNLYAGHTGRGLAQLLLSVLSCWILWLPMFIWVIVEVCSETKDSTGSPMV